MNLVHSLSDSQIEQLHQLYQQHWWTKGRSLDATRRCVRGSTLVFGLIADDALAGFARVLTDYVFKALIFDLIVDAKYRNRGLGRAIMREIRCHNALSGVQHFELYCRADMMPYYRSMGFTEALGDLNLMRLLPN